MSEQAQQPGPRLQTPGIVLLVGTFLGAPVEGALLFAAAGTTALPRAFAVVGRRVSLV